MVIDNIVAYANRNGTLAVPRSLLSGYEDETGALLSLSILVEGPKRHLLFIHHFYLNHLTTTTVLKEIHDGSRSLLAWLSEDDQALMRRGQLRQVLSLLRDEDHETYVESLKQLIDGTGVRFHLKELAMQTLGQADVPSRGEIDLALDLIDRSEWGDRVVQRILLGRREWFDALHERGLLRRWLDSPDESKVGRAIGVLRGVVGQRDRVIERLLIERGRERWPGRLSQIISGYTPTVLSDSLFDQLIAMTERGELPVRSFVTWKELALFSPGRCLRLLQAQLVVTINEIKVQVTRPKGSSSLHVVFENFSLLLGATSLRGVVEDLPLDAWDRLKPIYDDLKALSRRIWQLSLRANRLDLYTNIRPLVNRAANIIGSMVIHAGCVLATKNPTELRSRLDVIQRPAKYTERLIARCMSAGPDYWSDESIGRLLADPWKFELGTRGDHLKIYGPAMNVLRRHAASCSDTIFAELVAVILKHRPAREIPRKFVSIESRRREDGSSCVPFAVLRQNNMGLAQHLLIAMLPVERLDTRTNSWSGVLKRNFARSPR